MRLPNAASLVALILASLAAGCGGKPSAPAGAPAGASGAPPIATTASDEFHYDDPCSLLEPAEVEAALGAPLATPPFRADNITPRVDGKTCRYLTADFRALDVDVEFTGGKQAFGVLNFTKKLIGSAPAPDANVKKAFRLADGTELTGAWDEATLMPMNCCIFAAVRGDQLIQIDFTATELALPKAASLVDKAFGRIEHPLKLDGGNNVAAATAFEGRRPKPVAACSLLTRAEVEAALGALAGEPVGRGNDSCSYELAGTGMKRIFELKITWRGGNAKLRSDAHVMRMAGEAMGGKGTGAAPVFDEPAAPSDAWERAGRAANDFAAIKKDVLVSADMRGLDHAATQQLVAAALKRI